MVNEIIWSENAIQDRLQILDYWLQRTGNNHYSLYLNNQFEHAVQIITQLPEIGRWHNIPQARFIVKENYLIFCEFRNMQIHILSVFDGRRNTDLINKIK
jgi:toxin YoeB